MSALTALLNHSDKSNSTKSHIPLNHFTGKADAE